MNQPPDTRGGQNIHSVKCSTGRNGYYFLFYPATVPVGTARFCDVFVCPTFRCGSDVSSISLPTLRYRAGQRWLYCSVLIGGVQFIMIGIIGVYLGKTFVEVKGRPAYIISDTSEIEETVTIW